MTRRRGSDARTRALFSYADLEERVLAKHSLRMFKADVLASLDAVSTSCPIHGPHER